MSSQHRYKITTYLTAGVLMVALAAQAQMPSAPKYPDISGDRGPVVRDRTSLDKLSLDLQILYRQYAVTRGEAAPQMRFTRTELSRLFHIAPTERNPTLKLALQVSPNADTAPLEAAGVHVQTRLNDTLYASAPVLSLQKIAADPAILSIEAVKTAHIPAPHPPAKGPTLVRGTGPERGQLANAFDHQGLTGKGVVVGILDSGIDWKHPDFRRPDGTSRLLYLYDMKDPSWEKGHIGTKPPLTDDHGAELGTLYTNSQIDAALKGGSTASLGMKDGTNDYSRHDLCGHGTACASTAAGSGRATANGVPEGTYAGVAPEADLIVVRVGGADKRAHYGEIDEDYVAAARWVAQTAQSLGKPCVINMSFGGQFGPHNGSEPDEKALDALVGDGKPGLVICAAAGNEAQDGIHAGGQFNPKPEGKDVIAADAVEIDGKGGLLAGYFSHNDTWGLALACAAYKDKQGHPFYFHIVHSAGNTYVLKMDPGAQVAADVQKQLAAIYKAQAVENGLDEVRIELPPGKCLARAYGATNNVTDGRFDLYTLGDDTFIAGADTHYTVGSPGTATNLITVGAYDFRSVWENLDGKQVSVLMRPGELSSYSSLGYRRDNVIKPEIVAPATYTISALAQGAVMGKQHEDENGPPDTLHITRDGYHLSWAGTSAASPYAAGVVALMLQKNPTLTAVQVREILKKTARTDEFTGGVPNRDWGYGKIDPVRALRETPAK